MDEIAGHVMTWDEFEQVLVLRGMTPQQAFEERKAAQVDALIQDAGFNNESE